MKFLSLKFIKNDKPKISSLRPPVFNSGRNWFLILGGALGIIPLTASIGAALFYFVYSEGYKKDIPTDSFSSLIDVNKLQKIIKERNNFLNSSSTIPRDPSL